MAKLASGTTIHLKNGAVRGEFNDSFYYFKGIPYAEPPIGALRFQPPQPLVKFPGSPLDCTEHRSIACQRDMFTGEFTGSEDCLYLNVYTPKLSGNYPVMFWIHGGGFENGSGDSNLYSPDFLIENQVVIVTINYRVGPLGFLSIPGIGIYGNMGLKDQLLALKWVHENISAFGGDPRNVTVFGESAGAVSAHLHLQNLESRKYFRRAILQSGNSLMDWVFLRGREKHGLKLLELLGCNKKEDQLKTLLTADPEKLTKLVFKTLSTDERKRNLPLASGPVVEIPNKTAFITQHSLKLLKQKDFLNGIPIISGVTDMEGILMKHARDKLNTTKKDFTSFVPFSLNVSPESVIGLKVGQEIQDFYLNREDEPPIGMAKYQTDAHFNVSHNINAEILARFQPKTPHFMYRFSFVGELNHMKTLFGADIPGACHADDLHYLFKSNLFESNLSEDSPEAKFIRYICRLWTNFAKYGDPTPDHDPETKIKWLPVAPAHPKTAEIPLNCMDLNRECKMIVDPDKERIDFWRNILKTWNESFLKPKF